MTAKEKANELIDKYYPLFDNAMSLYMAKKCALIAVDEIINTMYEYHLDYEWWNEVKQEIEKL